MLNTIESKSREQYMKHCIKGLSRQNNEPGWMLGKRLAAFGIFKSRKMPDFIYGPNIDIDVGLDLDQIAISKSDKPGIQIKNCNKSAIIENFSGMPETHKNVIKEKFMSIVGAEDKFTAFHSAFLNNLTFIYAPDNTEANEPIELISKVDSNTVEHLIVLVGNNAKLNLACNLISDGDNVLNKSTSIKNNSLINKKCNNHVGNKIKNDESKINETANIGKNSVYHSRIVEIFVGNNSAVNYDDVQLLNKNIFNYSIKRASVGNNSSINWADYCFGSKTTLSEITTFLDGEGAKANSYGVFFGSKCQQFDLAANSVHNAPHTASSISAKGVLSKNGKCIYRGLVKISKNAFGSSGYQKEDALLLGKDAVADSMPKLEISNDEVKCAHGASIGRIGREKMFYMMSRGLSEKQAAKEYVKGFFEPLVQKMQINNLKGNMLKMIGKIEV